VQKTHFLFFTVLDTSVKNSSIFFFIVSRCLRTFIKARCDSEALTEPHSQVVYTYLKKFAFGLEFEVFLLGKA
jgi:hypothetical protein